MDVSPSVGDLKNGAKWWQIFTGLSVTAQCTHKQSEPHLWYMHTHCSAIAVPNHMWPPLFGRVSRLTVCPRWAHKYNKHSHWEKVFANRVARKWLPSLLFHPTGGFALPFDSMGLNDALFWYHTVSYSHSQNTPLRWENRCLGCGLLQISRTGHNLWSSLYVSAEVADRRAGLKRA